MNDSPSLEEDLLDCSWIKEKVKADKIYAQNLYAALCNMQWQKLDVLPLLTDEVWHCSWRYAGGIIARLKSQGDYLDYYCSGIGDETPDTGKWIDRPSGYVPEGTVTEEIQADLNQLGWAPRPYKKD